MGGNLKGGAQRSRLQLAALPLRTVQAVADQVRRTRTEPPPAAPRGAGLDEKKPFTAKGSVWLELEAVTSEPVSVRDPGLGERHHLHPHAQRLAVLGGGAGPVRAQGRGLGDGA